MSLTKLTLPSKWVLVSLIAAVTIAVLGFLDVVELRAEEPRRAEIALEMVQSADAVALKLNGETYYNKPPFSTWITAGLMKLTGNYGDTIARLPGAISFLLLGFLWFKISKKYLAKELALLSALGFLSAFNLLFYGAVNTAEIDLLYALIVALQGLSIFHFSTKEKYTTMFVVSYLLCAAGVLTKGLPSFAFQAITLLTWCIAIKKFRLLFSWRHFLGIAVLFAILGSYFYTYNISNNAGDYLANLFDQASQKSVTQEGISGTLNAFFTNPLKLLHIALPWSLGLFFLAKKEVRNKLWNNPFLKFCVLFIGANFILYWISSDVRDRYLYMFLPFICTVSVFCLDEGFSLSKKRIRIAGLICASLIVLGALGHTSVLFIQTDAVLSYPFIFLVGVLVLVSAYVTFKNSSSINFMWTFILGLFLLRLSFNLIALPITQEKINKGKPYREIAKELAVLSNGEPITFLGTHIKLHPDVAMFGVEEKVTIEIPPDIPFQIPYYYFLETGNVLRFTDKGHGSGYYLGYSGHLARKIAGDTLFQMRAFGNADLQLIRVD